jgi:nucleotide-binding universal stress UspA family protein
VFRASEAQALLSLGLDRLKRLGLQATGEVVTGEPIGMIAGAAQRFGADLIVVGHRRQSLFERWWSGPSETHIIDHVGCSVMIARDTISDAEFEKLLAAPET